MRLVEEERVHHLVAHLVGQNLRHLEQQEHRVDNDKSAFSPLVRIINI